MFQGKKQICAGKSSSYSLYNCFGKTKACWHWIDCVSPYYCAISLKSISPYCRVHFFLVQNAFLLTSECISTYCIWSLKDPAHHIPNRTEIATEEFCPKSLLRKQNEIDFVESHFQIFSMEWKKISSIEYGKILFHSIPSHALPGGLKLIFNNQQSKIWGDTSLGAHKRIRYCF